MAGERPVTRRRLLQGAAGAAVVGGVGGLASVATPKLASGALNGETPIRMAMHIHASFSEGAASMQAHLAEAERTGVDVIWWTEHDHRMVARGYVSDVHFNALTEWTDGVRVVWVSSFEGQLANSSASIVSQPASANDPGDRAMRMSATSKPDAIGTRTVRADARNSALTTSLDGTTVVLDVRPVDIGEDAFFDIVVETSYRPAMSGRPAGQYRLRYRVGGGRPPGTVVETDPLNGLIVLDVPVKKWTTLSLDPVSDLTTIWPDVDFRDAALTRFAFAVTSRNGVTSTTVVDGLHFERVRKTSTAVLAVQRELMEHYTPLYPTVVQQQGLELSHSTPHVNWFGEPEIWPASDPAHFDVELAIAQVHAAGGVASYNHPFGTSGGPFSTSQRLAKRRSVTSAMLQEHAFGADIVEVGYTQGRAGMLENDYLAMWDVLSRNLVLVTGTGATDDHEGLDWTAQRWRHVTGVWAAGTDVSALQTAILAGRAWFYDPAEFNGTIDLLGAGFVPMGSVGVVDTERCTVKIRLKGVPTDWSVAVVSGVVDEAGPSMLDPAVKRRVFPASDVVKGVLKVRVPTASSSFHRVELRNAAGAVRAYSNPLWLLRSIPYTPIPDQRWASRETTSSTSPSTTSVEPSPSTEPTP
ncbi:MAG TPA: hypothetical protein VFX15_02675 [Actinomycetes bacterium]|nr:hypothetical protein [Actinomycetes bacterium]